MKQPSDDLGGRMVEMWSAVAKTAHLADSGVVCPQRDLEEFLKWIRIDYLHSRGDTDSMIALKLGLCDGSFVGKLRRAYESCPPARALSMMLLSADGNAFAYQLAVGFGVGGKFTLDSATDFFQIKLGKNCGITRDNIEIIVRDAKRRRLVKRCKGGNFEVVSLVYCHARPDSQIALDLRLARAQRTIHNRRNANVNFSAAVSLTKEGLKELEEYLEPENGKNPIVPKWHQRMNEATVSMKKRGEMVKDDNYGMVAGITPAGPGMSLADALLDFLGAKINQSTIVIPGTGVFDQDAINAFASDAKDICKRFRSQLAALEKVGQGERTSYLFVFMAAPWI